MQAGEDSRATIVVNSIGARLTQQRTMSLVPERSFSCPLDDGKLVPVRNWGAYDRQNKNLGIVLA